MQDEARHQANKASGWFGARRDEAEDQADRAGNYVSRKSRDASDEADHQANKASGWFGARRDEAEDQADRAGNYASRKSRDACDSAEDQGRCAAAPTASSRNQQGKRWAGTQAEHSVKTGSQGGYSQLEAAVCTAKLCQPTAALSASSSAAVQVAICDLHCHLHCDLHLRTLSVFHWFVRRAGTACSLAQACTNSLDCSATCTHDGPPVLPGSSSAVGQQGFFVVFFFFVGR